MKEEVSTGWGVGAGEGSGEGLGSGDMHPFIPSCQWKGWWQEQQQQSWLAFNLCKAPGVWVCHLKFFFSNTMIPKEKEKEKGIPCYNEEGWIMWKKKANQLCGKPHLPLPPAPTVIKNRILDRCLWFSSAHVNWKYGRKYLIDYKINASFSQFKKKLGEEGRPKGAIEMYACIKINRTLCDPHTWFTTPEVVEVGGLTNRVQVCVSFETDKASRRDSGIWWPWMLSHKQINSNEIIPVLKWLHRHDF